MKKITNETWDHLKSMSLDNGIFHPFKFGTLCQFHSSTSPVLFTKLLLETIEWEKRRFFANMAASAYDIVFKVKNHIIQNWIFRHTCCINNPHWQISGIIVYIV